jgi:hypothetical protein
MAFLREGDAAGVAFGRMICRADETNGGDDGATPRLLPISVAQVFAGAAAQRYAHTARRDEARRSASAHPEAAGRDIQTGIASMPKKNRASSGAEYAVF